MAEPEFQLEVSKGNVGKLSLQPRDEPWRVRVNDADLEIQVTSASPGPGPIGPEASIAAEKMYRPEG